MTVPRSAVARIAPPSQAGDVDADDGHVGRSPGGGHRVAQPDRVAGVGHHDLVGQPGGAQQRGLPLVRDDADRARPRRAGPRRGSASRTYRRRRRRRRSRRATPRDVLPHHAGGQRRRTADVHHREARSVGRSSGSTAAIERPNSTAYPSHGTCSPRPSQSARPSSMTSRGERQGDQRGDPVPHRQAERRLGPTSSTVPTSMPPEPVSGFCILPRASTMSRTSRLVVAAPSPPCFRSSWR